MAGYAVTFTVVDQATKQIDSINKRIEAMRAPIERMSKQVNRFVDVSGLGRVAKGFEWIGRAAGSVLRTMVEIVPVLGTITGAATIAGMAKLVQQYSSWSQQLVSTADSLGMTTQQIQQFQDATRLAGGNADDMTDSLKSLYKLQTDFVRGQASADSITWLNRLGINVRDATGHLRNMSDMMPEVLQKIAAIPNAADRAAAAQQLLGEKGMALVETFRRSHGSFLQWFNDASRYTELSEQQKDQLQSFAEAQGRVGTAFDHLGQQISATLAKNFTPLLNKLAEFVEKHTPQIIAAVDRISSEFSQWLQGIDWNKVQQGLDSVMSAVKWLIDHFGEVKAAMEAILAIKFAATIVGSISQIVTAIGVAGGLAGGIGLLGGIGAIAALTLIVIDHWKDFGEIAKGVMDGIGSAIDRVKKTMSDFAQGKTPEGPREAYPTQAPSTPGGAWAPTGQPSAPLGGAWAPSSAPTAPLGGAWAGAQDQKAGTPAAPLGLPPTPPGQAPAMVSALPGDPTWGDYGTRANNPGNMDYASWQNASGRYSYFDKTEGRQHTMAVYNTMEEGIADTYKLMARKQAQYGKTISGALSAWSTSPGYAAKVAGTAGLDPNAPFDITTADPDTVRKLMSAQFQWEGGKRSHFATSSQILGGINMARAPAATVPSGGTSGRVDVAVTGKNLPPNTAVTATGTGSVNVPPPRVEHQTLDSIGGTVS